MKRPAFGAAPATLRRGRVLSMIATGLLVLAMALAVLLADTLEARFGLRRDYSYNGITSLNAITTDALRALRRDVHIYALFTPGQEDRALVGLLERYAAASDHITYSIEDLLRNPMLANRFSNLPGDHPVTTDSLAVTCADTGRTRVLDGTNYVARSYDPESGGYAITGYTYEKSLTEAILFVTSDDLPRIRLLTGHAELAGSAIAPLTQVLRDANFEVAALDLKSGEALKPNDILFILSPGRDLLAQELEQIQAFVNSGGSVLITSDYDAPDALPGFASLYAMFGFSLKPGIVVAERDHRGSYYETPAYLMPYMLSSPVTMDLIAARRTTLILPGARAFALGAPSLGVQAQPLLRSGPAYLRNVTDATESLEKADTDEQGEFTLALFAEKSVNGKAAAKAFAMGSSAPLTDSWLHTNTYSVELLMQALDALGARPAINLNIAQKQAIRTPLALNDSVLPGMLLAAGPLAVLVPALIVYRRRRAKT